MSPEIQRLRRRFYAATRRLKRHSGIPGTSGCFDFEKYEVALADCDALAEAIEEAGAKRPLVTDIRAEFQDRAPLALAKAISS